MTYLYFLILLLIIWIVRFVITRDNLKRSKELNKAYNEWINNSGTSKRPNNATFSELFNIVYKRSLSNDLPESVKLDKNSSFISSTRIKENFPVMYGQLVSIHKLILKNLQDYFEIRYKENFSPSFWIKFYAFLPERMFSWMGVRKETIIGKIADVIYWIVCSFFLFMKPIVLNFINHLLR